MKQFIALLVFLSAQIGSAQTGSAQSTTDLQKYIQSYQSPIRKANLQEAKDLRERITKDTERFGLFYDGPADDGGDRLDIEEWKFHKLERAHRAQQFLKSILQKSTEEINLFSLELMRRYLDEPNSRPAIKELAEAMQSSKFNDEFLNRLDASKDARTSLSRGFVIGGIAAGAFCIFKPSTCSNLFLRQNLVRESQEAARSSRSATHPRKMLGIFKRSAVETSEVTLRDVLRSVNANFGHIAPSAAETVGSAITKKSVFKQYFALGFKTRMSQMGVVAGVGSIGATGTLIYDKIQQARREGKFEYEALAPHELEQKYFGALAVLEMTCQARSYLTSYLTLDDQSINADTLADFIVDANQQLQILGRTAGSIRVFDKTPLEFVNIGADGNSIDVHIDLTKDKALDFSRSCPGASDLGTPVTTSLAELEGLLRELLARLPN